MSVIAGYVDDNGNLLHYKFGDMLINKHRIVAYNDNLYIYKDGYYVNDNNTIQRAMIDLYPSISSYKRREVLSYIKIKVHLNKKPINNPYFINIKNGRLDLLNADLFPHTPDEIDFIRVPVKFNPTAYCKIVDQTLNKVFLGDREVRKLFEELLGYCLIRNTKYQRGFILYGKGSNGKSTILKMMREFLGKENTTSIALSKIHHQFTTQELDNKLANIGDDLDPKQLKETGTIKKLISGEGMLVDIKYEQPVVLYNHAKMIFSTNYLPRSIDKSKGFYRRFEFIPFNAQISENDDDFDPFIEDKLTTEEAKSYLLNIAIKGINRLIRQNTFTYPEVVRKVKEQYKKMNSTVLTFLDDELIEPEGRIISEIYDEYVEYCKKSNVKYVSRVTFSREICEYFDVESTPERTHNDKVERVFRKVGG